MSQTKTILKTIRIPFLVLTPVCVLLGVSTAIFNEILINYINVLIIFFGALFSHMSVNMLNEYFDFKSGLDLITDKTAFSGGSGALPSEPEYDKNILRLGIMFLIFAFCVGIYFINTVGVGILPIGIVGFFLIISYSDWINKHPFFCLITPGLGFSLIVIGTQYILIESYSFIGIIISLIPFLLINNLLLLNQYPDIDADKTVGRNHMPIAYGVKVANLIYISFVLITVMLIIICVIENLFPKLSLIAILPLLFTIQVAFGIFKYGKNIGKHSKYLAINVIVTMLVPILLGLSLII